MPQPTTEVDAFIERVKALPEGPGVSLDAALQPALEDETELRKLFATDRQNERISNPHVGLVDVFAAPDAIRTTRARVVQDKEGLSAKYVMPIAEEDRRVEGAPCMVSDIDEFRKNWSIFSEGSLSQLLDWNNVVAAGGSVLACLAPLEEEHKKSKRATRKFYHNQAYPTSDVDLFLWGMDAEQAEKKIVQIYEAVRDSVPWDVTCIRTKHTISIHSQYPYRSVQIVLRLYKSPAEILAGFDIDAPCCAYDGTRVWANPRAVVAMMRQCNTIDVTRRSPSYEVRLAKYARRGFEIYVPALVRNKVDPTIYERSILKMEGLARLLVLEKLRDEKLRDSFLRERRELRGRPRPPYRQYHRHNRTYKGDLKQEEETGLEMNDYDVGTLHIPYGPGWDAKRIDKLIYQTDLGMNSTFNPRNEGRRLHRHPAFFGTIEEVIGDCCEHCPEPIDQDERDLQAKEDESYIRGRVKFIEENPGRQSMTGSFNPIDDGEWSGQVYTKPTEQFFKAIAARDRATVQRLLSNKEEPVDVHQRDHVGRTCLHVAILSRAEEIAMDIVDADARITARLADGRGPMHLSARYDMPRLIKKLVERSKKNEAEEEKKADKIAEDEKEKPAVERPSSEDDWSSHDDEDVVMSAPEDDEDADDEGDEDGDDDSEDGKKAAKVKDEEGKKEEEPEEVPVDKDEEPDIIDINIHDWDFGYTALCYAIIYASQATIDALLVNGADPKLPSKPGLKSHISLPAHPLLFALMRDDDEAACIAIESLLQAGATSTTANDQMRTLFYTMVKSGRNRLIETVLRNDHDIHTVINFPTIAHQNVDFPITAALREKAYATLLLLVAHGAKIKLDEADVSRAVDSVPANNRNSLFGYQTLSNYLLYVIQPVEHTISHNDDIVFLLIQLGASVDLGLRRAYESHQGPTGKRSIKDWVDNAVLELAKRIQEKEKEELAVVDPSVAKSDPVSEVHPVPTTGWLGFWTTQRESFTPQKGPAAPRLSDEEKLARQQQERRWELERLRNVHGYFVEVQAAFSEKKAKTWSEIHPDILTMPLPPPFPASKPILPSKAISPPADPPKPAKPPREYRFVYLGSQTWNTRNVPEYQLDAYDELFEACYAGDNAKVQTLCLPTSGQSAAPGAPSPLNIGVKMVNASASYYTSDGYTPFYAALAARKWSTARLVLAIAVAQYHPESSEEKPAFDFDVDMDDDSDAESDDSCESDITIAQKQITFIDIAKRSSEVRSEMHPRQFLQVPAQFLKEGEHDSSAILTCNPITTAVHLRDLEAFKQVANLYATLPTPTSLPNLMDVILAQDQPDILDEYIRRTGEGIDQVDAKSSKIGTIDDIPVAMNDENKTYLGLNVHGKKRMDLAQKNDPNAVYDNEYREPPLLWRAIRQGSKSVISYLASDKPLVAYQRYMSAHSDRKAIWFKRLGDNLEKNLPTWLGWIIDHLGESPVSAAILAGDVEILKLLTKLNQRLINEALRTNIKFLGLNPLLLAVRATSAVPLVNYLLGKKISPSERDGIKGWNILHFICEANKGELLKYFLEKLPRDVIETLLNQHSRLRRNTPLHVAVKKGHEQLVSMLLNYSKDNVLAQDVDGQTPLHCAAKLNYSSITEYLLAALPSKAPDLEDAVGNTAFEIISLKELANRASDLEKTLQTQRYAYAGPLFPNSFSNGHFRISSGTFDSYESTIQEMRYVVDNMLDRAPIPIEKKDAMKENIIRWLDKTTSLINALKAEEAARASIRREWAEADKKFQSEPIKLSTEVYKTESARLDKTFEAFNSVYGIKSVGSAPNEHQRLLIHLLDVQKSVGSTLAKVNPSAVDSEYGNTSGMSYTQYQQSSRPYRRYNRRRDDTEGLENEESEEFKERKNSLVFQTLATPVDSL